MSVEERRVSVDGLSVRYLEAGSGPPVIMLHGAQAYLSADIFAEVMEPIADRGFRVIAYDQPGYGLTDNPSDFRASYRIGFVTNLMDVLGLESAALVGHAHGGGMVVRLALREPRRFTAVVVVSNLTLVPPLPEAAGDDGRLERTASAPSTPTLASVRMELEGDVYNKSLVTAELVARKLLLSLGKNFEAAAGRRKAREPWSDAVPVWERLQEISVPLLLLFGAQDRDQIGERALVFKERHPDIDIRLLENAAHLLMLENPGAFTAAVLECLASR